MTKFANSVRSRRLLPLTGLSVLGSAAVLLMSGAANAVTTPKGTAPVPVTIPNPLTLDQAVSITLSHLPAVDSSHTQIDEANGIKEEAQSQYFPHLTLGYDFIDETDQEYGMKAVTVTPGITPSETYSAEQGGGATVALSQLLFDSGTRENDNALGRQGVYAAKDLYEYEKQTAALNTTVDYYTLLLDQDLIKVAQSQVTLYQQTVDLTNAQIQAGTEAASSIYQAQADLANAKVTLLQDQNSVLTATATLKNVMGVETDAPLILAPAPAGTDGLPTIPAAPPVETLDNLLTVADQKRPDLDAQEHAVEEQEIDVKQAQENAGITINATYTGTLQATNDVGPKGLDSELLATATYPIFDGGYNQGAVRAARALAAAAKDKFKTVRQEVRLQVEQALDNQTEAFAASDLAEAAVKAAQVNVDAALAERKEGVGTTLDVTTAVATLATAQNQYVTAVYNTYSTQAILDETVGRIDTSR